MFDLRLHLGYSLTLQFDLNREHLAFRVLKNLQTLVEDFVP